MTAGSAVDGTFKGSRTQGKEVSDARESMLRVDGVEEARSHARLASNHAPLKQLLKPYHYAHADAC